MTAPMVILSKLGAGLAIYEYLFSFSLDQQMRRLRMRSARHKPFLNLHVRVTIFRVCSPCGYSKHSFSSPDEGELQDYDICNLH